MATFLLSVLIFGSAAAVIYRQTKNSGCEDCSSGCTLSKETSTTIKR